MMKSRLFWLLGLSIFFVSPSLSHAAYDFSLASVRPLGPFYHSKSTAAPSTILHYEVGLSGDEAPKVDTATVSIELYHIEDPENPICMAPLEIDIRDMHPVEVPTRSFDYDFALHDEGIHYELGQGWYYFRVVFDPRDEILESDEENNVEESTDFEYRIFSDLLLWGETQTELDPGTSIAIEAPYCAPTPYHIASGGATWTHGWGAETLSLINLCCNGSLNEDGYSIDLSVVSGSAMAGDISGSVGGLAVLVTNVTLEPIGMGYTQVEVALPGSVAVHNRPAPDQRISPIGKGKLTFPSAGFVQDPTHIVVEDAADTTYFHGYGLPFYVHAQDGILLELDSGSPGILLQNPDPYYVHIDTWALLHQKDRRKQDGLPSNDVLFVAGDSTGSYVDGNGIQGNFTFVGSSDWVEAGGHDTRTLFPHGRIHWNAFSLSVEDGQLLPVQVPGVRFRMPFLGECPDCKGRELPPPTDYLVGPAVAGMAPDGALGMQFGGLGGPTEWGQMTAGGDPTYYRDDAVRTGILYLPGFVAAGTADGQDLSGYLLGSRNFNGPASPGQVHYLESAEAKAGNGYFAGMNIGPGTLEPAVAADYSDSLAGTALAVLFDGNTSATSFSVTAKTKYFLRPGGLTGVFNTNFSNTLTVYGYPLELERFAFRQALNHFDDDTLIDGWVDLPKPAELRVYFNSLDLTCTGNFTDGEVDNEAACDQSDNDSDGRTDEGCWQALDYWNVPVIYLGMGFDDPYGKPCPSGDQKLKLVTSNQVNGISHKVTLTSFWEPDGTPFKDHMTGPPQLVMDSSYDGQKKGFAVQVRDGYLNRPFDKNGDDAPDWNAPDQEPPAGFTNLVTVVDVPLFDAPTIHGHLKNEAVDGQGQVAPNKYALYLADDASDTDKDLDGIPDNISVNYVTDYWSMLAAESPSPDPRPEVTYSWPNSGSVILDYRLRYEKASADKGPRFVGVKETTKLAESNPTILTVYSVPDYIDPERTKLSFGAGAEFTQLKNLHVTVASAAVNTFFSDALGIDLGLDLDGLFGLRDELLKLVGADLTPLAGGAIDSALRVGDLSDGIDDLAEALQDLHSVPSQVTSKIQNPIVTSQQKAMEILEDKKDANGSVLAKGLFRQLEELYKDQDLLAIVKYDRRYPVSGEPTGQIPALQAKLEGIKSKLNSLITGLRDGKASIEAAKPEIAKLTTKINAAEDKATNTSTGAVKAVKDGLQGLNHFFSTDQNTNPVLQNLKKGREALTELKDVLKDVNMIQAELQKVNDKIRSYLKGEVSVSSIMQVISWIKEKVPQLEQLLAKADQHYQTALAFAQMDQMFNGAKSQLDTVGGHVVGLATQLKGNVLIEADEALRMAATGIEVVAKRFEALYNILDGEGDLGPTTWSGLAAAAKYELDQHAIHTLDKLRHWEHPTGAFTLTGLNLVAEFLYAQADNTSDPFIPYVRGMGQVVSAPVTEANGQFTPALKQTNQLLQTVLPSPKGDDIRSLIRTATLNSAPMRQINKAFFAQFDFISDAFDQLVQGLAQHFNQMINQLVEAAATAVSEQLKLASSPIGVGGKGGLNAAKIDGYAVVSQDEIERFHLEAELGYDTKPEPMIFHAGLDISRWRPINERPSECCPPGNGVIDACIFSHNVPIKIMGGKLKVKKVLIGFILDEATPIGTFGELNLKGGQKAGNFTLEDMGAVNGLTWGGGAVKENYVGAKCRGKFEDVRVNAAFFLGHTCGPKVLRGLDKDFKTYIGSERAQFSGMYTRASARFPVYNLGCVFKIGVGADAGLWFFANPPVMYGGLFGGTIYGKVACVVSGKGQMTMSGSKTDGEFRFSGSAWAAAGLGFCDPDDWHTVEDSRKDGWCSTWDAVMKIVMSDSWSVDDRDTSGPH